MEFNLGPRQSVTVHRTQLLGRGLSLEVFVVPIGIYKRPWKKNRATSKSRISVVLVLKGAARFVASLYSVLLCLD
jgi:hypothetical protein